MRRSFLLWQSMVVVVVLWGTGRAATIAGVASEQAEAFARIRAQGSEPYRLLGLNFSPYTQPGENPNFNQPGQISQEEMRVRLEGIAPHTEWIRTFGCTGDLEPIGATAHALGLKTAIGAWVGRDENENRRQILGLVRLAKQGHVDMAIVGSETLLRNDVTPEQLIAYVHDVKSHLRAAGLAIPVTTADVYGEFLAHPEVVAEVDVVFANYYPYWEGRSLRCALAYLHRSYEQLRTAAGGKQVIVSETGWPSCGDRKGDAVPSPESAAEYFLTFVSWARANAVEYFYFSAYDEPWKVGAEGPQGACWGLWTSTGELKPGMEQVFDGATAEDRWSTCPSTEPTIDFFAQPDRLTTNIENFLVSGFAGAGTEVLVNGVKLQATNIDDAGHFAVIVPLPEPNNTVDVSVRSGDTGEVLRRGQKTICRDPNDPNYSTRGRRLVYVDVVAEASIPEDSVPALDGTVVIDIDREAILGILSGKHVRGISPDASEIYMDDNTVISTNSHARLRTLAFSETIPHNGFLVSPDRQHLYSRNEIVHVPPDPCDPYQHKTSIITGLGSWAGASIPGGPAISTDGWRIFCRDYVTEVNTLTLEPNNTPISGSFMSDIAVSPDDSLILVSEYSYADGRLKVYDATTFNHLATVTTLGDFVGEIAFASGKVIVGSAGNPAWEDGGLAVIDMETWEILSHVTVPLADNVVASDRGEVFVSTGQADDIAGHRLGVDMFVVSKDGQLSRAKTFFLGVNRFVSTIGKPTYDQIRRIIYKPGND